MAATSEIFTRLRQLTEVSPELFSRVQGTVLWRIQGERPQAWVIRCKDHPSVEEGESSADVLFECDEQTLQEIAKGELVPHDAFVMDKLRLGGDYMTAVRFSLLLNTIAPLSPPEEPSGDTYH